jgi:hypothetical protein
MIRDFGDEGLGNFGFGLLMEGLIRFFRIYSKA